jgi:hypothetical protein
MKTVPLLVCFGFAVARTAAGQAFGESVQFSQPAVHNTGAAASVPVSSLGPHTGAPQQSGVEVVNDVYRGQATCHCAQPPMFLPGPKEVTVGTQVVLSSPEPDAVIYYTTDGWTPTESSSRYKDPIIVTANTRIQAFAEVRGKSPSAIIAASYTISGAAQPLPINATVSGSLLAKGTQLRLQTGNRVTSETANVGDHFYLLLDQNIVANGTVIAPRGMSVEAVVTAVERAGQNGRSGEIVFQPTGLSVHGLAIPLIGTFTLVAPDIGSQLHHIADTSFVHVAGPLPAGNEAKIEPGMMVTALVAADTPIKH